MAVQVSYYNESLTAWEPLLEPVMSEGEKSLWELHLKVRNHCLSVCLYVCSSRSEPHLSPSSSWPFCYFQVFMAEGYRASFAPCALQSCDGPPKDVTDASLKPAAAKDVTDARPRPWVNTQNRSWRRKNFRSSFKRSKKFGKR